MGHDLELTDDALLLLLGLLAIAHSSHRGLISVRVLLSLLRVDVGVSNVQISSHLVITLNSVDVVVIDEVIIQVVELLIEICLLGSLLECI